MAESVQFNAIRFGNVVFSHEGVALFSQDKLMLSIPKNDIRKITLRYGYQSERPLIQVIFGVVLSLTGFYFVISFIHAITAYRTISATLLLTSFTLLTVGIWSTLGGLRQQFYFEVVIDNDMRKFPLGDSPDEDQLLQFNRYAATLGYVINSSILDETD